MAIKLSKPLTSASTMKVLIAHIAIVGSTFSGFAANTIAAEVAGTYCVVSFVSEDDQYDRAAERLTKVRHATALRAELSNLDSLRTRLQEINPEYVAFVVRPEQLNENLANRILKLSTTIDNDPFVDFSYGFITGRTPSAAVKLASAGVEQEKQRRPTEFTVAGVAGGMFLKRSSTQAQQIPLGDMTLRGQWTSIVNPDANNGQRDAPFIRKLMADLEGKSMFALAGHGFPDRVVGGPNWKDLIGHDYTGSVAFNIACYTGVTGDWYEDDWTVGKTVKRCVNADQSFGLRMLDTGVAAYIAYSCSRPAGPEMFADMISLATQGISVGEQRRRVANHVVMTHLGQGFDGVVADQVREGVALDRKRTVDEIVRRMSTGSLLFGDPAFIPFVATQDSFPVTTNVDASNQRMTVDVSVSGQRWFWHCSDPLEQRFFRVNTVVPFEDRHLVSAQLSKSPFDTPATRVNAAIEHHRGSRLLHLKAIVDRPNPQQLSRYFSGIRAQFVVTTSEDVSQGREQYRSVSATKDESQ